MKPENESTTKIKYIRLKKQIKKASKIEQDLEYINFIHKIDVRLPQEIIQQTQNIIKKEEFQKRTNQNKRTNKIIFHKNTQTIRQMEKQKQCLINITGLDIRGLKSNPDKTKRFRNTTRESQSFNKNTKFSNILKKDDLSFTISDKRFHQPFSEMLSRSPKKFNELQKEKCRTSNSAKSPNKIYLYQKLAGTENKTRQQHNVVYEKRIKSYLQLIWKISWSHCFYPKLDLGIQRGGFGKSKKLKAFLGFGNNSLMVQGIIKRRFWWNIVDQYSEDCQFVWTQIKINNIFSNQTKASQRIFNKKQQNITISQRSFEQKKETLFKESKINKNYSLSNKKILKFSLKGILIQKLRKQQFANHKILNQNDFKLYEQFYENTQMKKQIQSFSNKTKLKQLTFGEMSDEMINYKGKLLKKTKWNQQQFFEDLCFPKRPTVHNHLQNNFHLGNKKALFYNLRDYYNLINEDVFDILPLTFHIKNGFKDKQYKKFKEYHQKRAKAIKKQQKVIQEGVKSIKKKTRNIWIVKPGQNSNRGNGITVIDQVYELNNIIKQSQKTLSKKNSSKSDLKDSKNETQDKNPTTFIVQQYIDRPFLYNERKFDIRHYMLITNIFGVFRAYWYEEGYVRTSSYKYNVHNFEPQIHLTNDAVQSKYPAYSRYQPFNKITYCDFQNYLNALNTQRKYDFKQQVIPKMKKIALDSVKSIYQKISPKNQMHNFQIFGLDYMIDRKFNPWLIEINTNPCLDCSSPLLDRLIPYMVEQSLKLSLDIVYPPPCHYPNTEKHYAPNVKMETFKYELIFDSTVHGEQIKSLYRRNRFKERDIIDEIGQIQEDQQFNDNGKQIKLEDYA